MNFWENEYISEKLSEYGNKSEEQLKKELFDVAQKLKSEGNFDIASIERFFALASPYLNEAQKGRMRALIDMLR